MALDARKKREIDLAIQAAKQRVFAVYPPNEHRSECYVLPVNENGVVCRRSYTGAHYQVTGKDHSQLIPVLCFSCNNFEVGEYGDMGSKLSPDYCLANVWWPTKQGTCKKYKGQYLWPTEAKDSTDS